MSEASFVQDFRPEFQNNTWVGSSDFQDPRGKLEDNSHWQRPSSVVQELAPKGRCK